MDSADRDADATPSTWTWEEDKQFEDGLVEFPEGSPNRWEKIAAKMRTKTPAEVERHYAVLLEDVAAIDAGLVDLPKYRVNNEIELRSSSEGDRRNPKSEKKPVAGQRKAAKAWTDDEHKAFLAGLKKYGKGDWKSISRYSVRTRSPAQVASHAQKYYERQEKEAQSKKRRSIFDNSIEESS